MSIFKIRSDLNSSCIKKSIELHENIQANAVTRRIDLQGSFSKNCSVLFLDIADFSSHVQNMKCEEIEKYLEEFYNQVLPLIEQKKGIIEKVMGDGIISFFLGRDSFVHALACAKNLIPKMCTKTKMQCKAAISYGRIHFCQIGVNEIYYEYTGIGTPLTEAYRLEALGRANQILFLDNSPFQNEEFDNSWWNREKETAEKNELKGVLERKFYRVTYDANKKKLIEKIKALKIRIK